MTSHRGSLPFLVLLLVATALWPSSARSADREVLDQFQKLLHSEELNRDKLDKKLVEMLKDLQAITATSKNKDLDKDFEEAESKIEDSKSDLLENHLRIEFLNTFITAMENSNAKDIRESMQTLLLDLAHKQILSGTETGNDSNVWLFEIYLSIAIKDILEPSENFCDFVKRFMVFSSLRDPRPPTEFLKNRDYITR